MPNTKVNDIMMYYETQGSGEPLLMIMGLGASSAVWDPEFVENLSRHYQTIIFDNRGTGQTDKPDEEYSMAMFAADAAGLLDQLGIDSAHILGVSMGGMIAQEFALRYPQKVRTLILSCTTCGGEKSVMATQEVLQTLTSREGLTLEETARNAWPIVFTEEFIKSNPAKLERNLERTLKHPTPLFAFNRQIQAVMKHDTYNRLPQIQTPTMVMTGTEDVLVPPENSTIIADRIPGAKLVSFDETAHGFITEASDDVASAMIEFIGQ